MRIIRPKYTWRAPLSKRWGKPPKLVWHHTASDGDTWQSIHSYAKKVLRWLGIPYHWLIMPNGDIVQGRPEWAMGGHAKHFNHCIGVALVGALHKHKPTPAQVKNARWLRGEIRRRHSGIKDIGHGSLPLNATQCPGRYFPMGEITKPATVMAPRRYRKRFKFALITWALTWNKNHPKDRIDIPTGVGWSLAWNRRIVGKLAWRVSKRIKGVDSTWRPTRELWNAVK